MNIPEEIKRRRTFAIISHPTPAKQHYRKSC
jgi:peptide subunit release factor RF-3